VGLAISTALVAADVSSKTDASIVCKKLLITLPFLIVVSGETTDSGWQAIALDATML
jgi:hypothetical protein